MEDFGVMEHDKLAIREFDDFKNEVRVDMLELKKSIDAMWDKLDGRPSWPVLFFMSGMMTVIGILSTLIFHFMTAPK